MSGLYSQLRDYGRRNEAWLWLAIIVVVATAVRLNGLIAQSYWFDELFSAYFSNPAHSFWRVVNLTLGDVHPPLYQLAMWASYKLFGYNELAGRLPSFLAGVATIPVIYFIGRELASKRVGLYAAALAIPNYYLVYYAQEARSYAFLYFLCSLSFLFFLRALRVESKLNIFLYISSTLALLYTHYFVFVALAAQGFILLSFMAYEQRVDRALITRAVVALGVILLAALPLIPAIVSHSGINDFWIQQPDAAFLVDYFVRYFNSPLLSAVFAVLLLAGVFSIALPAENSRSRFAATALLIWVVVGYLLPWLRGVVTQPVLTDRNTIMLIPPILLLASMGLTRLKPYWLQRLAGLLLVVYSLWYLLAVVDYDDQIRKNQYREIAMALSAFDASLPIYTLQYNDTKFNVYFEQQQSDLRAQDHSILAGKLADGTAESLFWIADGFNLLMRTELDEKYNLSEAARYRFEGTMAVLYVNPAASVNLTLAPLDDHSDGVFSYVSESFVLENGNSILLSVANEGSSATEQRLSLELLDEQANILATTAIKLTGMDSAFQYKPVMPSRPTVSVRISSSSRLDMPKVWLLNN